MLCEDNGCVWRSSRIRSRRRGNKVATREEKKGLLRSSTIYEYVISVHTVAGAVRRCSTRAMCILRWSDSNHTNAGSARVAVPVSTQGRAETNFVSRCSEKKKEGKIRRVLCFSKRSSQAKCSLYERYEAHRYCFHCRAWLPYSKMAPLIISLARL